MKIKITLIIDSPNPDFVRVLGVSFDQHIRNYLKEEETLEDSYVERVGDEPSKAKDVKSELIAKRGTSLRWTKKIGDAHYMNGSYTLCGKAMLGSNYHSTRWDAPLCDECKRLSIEKLTQVIESKTK